MATQPEVLRFLSRSDVLAVASKFGTPIYVYDETTLRRQAKAALNMPNAFGLTVRFAMKTIGNNPTLLQVFQDQGIDIDASSEYEANEAVAAGFAPRQIAITTQQFPDGIVELIKSGAQFNASSLYQLETYGKLLPGSTVGIRINPGLGSGHSSKVNVGGPSSSFGIWHEYTDKIARVAEQYNLVINRIHTHIGSGSDPAVWTKVADMTLNQVENFPAVTTVDLGGGFKVARMEAETATDLQAVGTAVKKSFQQFANKTGRKLHLEIEPGNFLIANAGAIVSRIIDLKDTGKDGYRFIVVDTGMTENLRPSLYGAQHPLIVVSNKPRQDYNEYVVVGHNCESGDLLTPKPGEPEAVGTRLLQLPEVGDLMVMEGTGAYCASMSAAGYNSFPAAKEVLRTAEGKFKDITRTHA